MECHFDLLVNTLLFWTESGLGDIFDNGFGFFHADGSFGELVIDDFWYFREGKLLF